jgi:hypothetical protein
MYKLHKSLTSNKVNAIQRLSDNVFIPFNQENSDYQAYLKWLDEGGIVLPADE